MSQLSVFALLMVLTSACCFAQVDDNPNSEVPSLRKYPQLLEGCQGCKYVDVGAKLSPSGKIYSHNPPCQTDAPTLEKIFEKSFRRMVWAVATKDAEPLKESGFEAANFIVDEMVRDGVIGGEVGRWWAKSRGHVDQPTCVVMAAVLPEYATYAGYTMTAWGENAKPPAAPCWFGRECDIEFAQLDLLPQVVREQARDGMMIAPGSGLARKIVYTRLKNWSDTRTVDAVFRVYYRE
jgi:hypothetical protein